MRKPRSTPYQQRYVAKLRAAGLVGTSAFLPRALSEQITARARQTGYTRNTVIEAALGEALRILTPSALQRVAQQRKRLIGEPARLLLAPSSK